ncbi:hypothetical protein BST92_01855 [Nonlabens arenilitoris]|uniref:6-phosphogluconolactonase n=1 Tax=Nonlabens arenilitoris TaxID=1217969 RepID=A0A2S7UFZ1_9FLAO|nr:hypothetical protein BST92_01855 [Nonlabens arenilitoris]
MTKYLSLFLVLILLFGCQSKKEITLLFVGSFTDKKPGEGIHVYQFNTKTGEASLKFTLDSITNTSFLKLAKNGKYLYSVMDSQMPYHGKIAAYTVDSINGTIELINTQDCGGLNPAHLNIDKTGTFLTNSNYSDGSISIFKIREDGGLNSFSQLTRFKDSSLIKKRQSASHIHSSNFSPDNNYLFVHDLGADKIRRFKLDFKSQDSILQNETQIQIKPGSGPRHFTFHPNGKFGYSIAELSGKIIAFKYQNNNLEFIEEYQSYKNNHDIYRAADIHISQDGNFLYASNRGPDEDTISIFSINATTGKLISVEHKPTYGEHPRNFTLSPCGNFILVANQFSSNVVVFRRDVTTGKLFKLPHSIKVNNPSSLQMQTYL